MFFFFWLINTTSDRCSNIYQEHQRNFAGVNYVEINNRCIHVAENNTFQWVSLQVRKQSWA